MSKQIIENNGFFEIHFSYSAQMVSAVKKIPGRLYDVRTKTWRVPMNKTSRKNIERFADMYNFKMGETQEEKFAKKTPSMPKLNVSDEVLNKLLKLTPYDYQRDGIAYSLSRKKVIIGDQPGLGKTAQAIATVTLANSFPCVVVCPASLKENWKREFEMWTDKKVMILNNSNKDTWHMLARGQSLFGVNMPKPEVFITNYESLKKFFVSRIVKKPKQALELKQIRFKREIQIFKSIIIDESHRVKDTSTQQTKYTKGLASGKDYILALTGTPVLNKPKDLVSQLGIIEQIRNFGGYKYFMQRYCAGEDNGNSHLKELNYYLKSHCFYRHEKKEVLKQLPDKVRQIVTCDIVTRKEYNEALSDLEVYLKKYKQSTDEEIARAMRGEVMVRIGILKKISARGKLNDVVSYVSDIIESGEKIVIFIHHKENAEYLKKMFPASVTVLGSNSSGEKQAAIDQFQNDPECQTIICSIKAAGVGITLTASSRVAFVELPWHPADTEQCEDRCILENEQIITDKGFINIQDVKIGTKVLTHKGRWKSVINTSSKLERKKSFLDIKYMGYDKPLRVTEDHKVYAYEKSTNSYKWIEAKHLDLFNHYLVFSSRKTSEEITSIVVEMPFGKDFIGLNGKKYKNGRKKNPIAKIKLTRDIMYAFGWYLAEGWSTVANNKGSNVSLCGNATTEKRHVGKLTSIICKSFGLEDKYNKYENTQNCYSTTIYSKNLAFNFLKWFGHTSANKHIPDFVYKSTKENIRAFLNGYYDGDGYKRKHTQQASTKSDKIAIGLCFLENQFKNPVTLRRSAWDGWSFEYSIQGKTKRNPLIINKDGYTLFPISEIKMYKPKRGHERVYDLTVEEDHSFHVGLTTVHNCHRIGQKDSVQCIYFLGKNTIDIDIYNLINKKRGISDQITGATNDVETSIMNSLIDLLNKQKEQIKEPVL